MNKKKEILEAAQPLFSQFGLKKVTTDDISKRSGVSKATIYKYFKNKNEIFHEVVQIETTQMILSIDKAINRETTLEGKLKTYLKTKIKNIHKLINFYNVTRENWDDHWPYIAEYHVKFLEYEKVAVTSILVEEASRAQLTTDNPEISAHILVISLKSIEYPWALEGLDISIDQLADQMIDTFIHGIRKKMDT